MAAPPTESRPPWRVAFHTLGCKLNQYESDALATEFQRQGFAIAPDFSQADICVINACTVTDKADRKSYAALGRAKRLATHAQLIIITGCFAPDSLANTDREGLESDGKTLVVENHRKSQIPALTLDRIKKFPIPGASDARGTQASDTESEPSLGDLAIDPFNFQLAGQVFHTRPSLKIQDGCDRFCSYCVIPSARGPAISRPVAAIETELHQLVDQGCREIILTGVNIGDYNSDGLNLSGLLRHLLNLSLPPGQDFRLRLGSLEPIGLGPDFATLFAHARLCPSLQLCLQSGSDPILQAMRRGYSVAEFCATVTSIRAIRPDLCLGTDLITGFPGESQADFQASLDCLEGLGLSHVHVFPYSRRHGTDAARFPHQVMAAIAEDRAAHVRQHDLAWRQSWLRTRLGQASQLLVEDILLPPGQDHIILSGRDQYGVLLQCGLPKDQARKLAGRYRQTPGRDGTPAILAKSPQLGGMAKLWNQLLLVKVMQVAEQTNGNPEPFLQAQIID